MLALYAHSAILLFLPLYKTPEMTPIFLALQVLWSDPSDSDANMSRGVHSNPDRGEGIIRFDERVTRAFCLREGVSILVRSHQVLL